MFDFLIGLGKRENIPLTLYLLLNVLLIGGILAFVFKLSLLWGMIGGSILYFATVSLAVSPVGEAFLRHQNGCRIISDRESVDRLCPIFQEVYSRARREFPELSGDVRLYMCEGDSPNAFATGRRTICITAGLMNLTDEEIKGTIAHEFGHLVHKDTDRILVVAVGNTMITSFCLVMQLLVILMDGMVNLITYSKKDREENVVIKCLRLLSRFISLIFIQGIMRLWSGLGTLLCMRTTRSNEYMADQFSCRLGYARGLSEMLSHFSTENLNGLFANLAESHPGTGERLARIKAFGIAGR